MICDSNIIRSEIDVLQRSKVPTLQYEHLFSPFVPRKSHFVPLKVSAMWRCWDWLADRSCSSFGTKTSIASIASMCPIATCSGWYGQSGRLQRRVWNSEKSGVSSSNTLEFTCIGTITFERKSDHGPSLAKKAYRDANKLPRSKMKNRLQVWPCQVQMTTVPVKLSSNICF